jgi:hypothetical protein
MNHVILTELIRRAESEPLGLWVACTNPRDLGRKLHAVRTELSSKIEIHTPGREGLLFLLQPSAELPL